jgi:hypothetical protein
MADIDTFSSPFPELLDVRLFPPLSEIVRPSYQTIHNSLTNLLINHTTT